MKKYAPYFLVVIIGLTLVILFYRWQAANQPKPQISPEGISIEDLTPEEQTDLVQGGVDDYQEVQLKPTGLLGKIAALGTLRYLVENGKFKFSAITQLPEPEVGKSYSLWIHPLNSKRWHKVTGLELKKGGFIGSAALPADILPVEVVISTGEEPSQVLDQALFKATVPAPEEQSGT